MMRSSFLLHLPIAVFCLLLLTSCGGGGGGESETTPPVSTNFAARAVAVESLEPRIGYPLTVSVTIESAQAAQNLSIAFFAVDRFSDPQQAAANTRQLPLGSHIIPQLAAGTQQFTFTLNIPASLASAGDYFIASIIDPANLVAENNEGDNGTTVETSFLAPEFPQLPPGNDPVNIFIQQLDPDRSVILLDNDVNDVSGVVDDVQNADAGATLYLGAQGSTKPIALEAFAALRFTRTDTTQSYDVPLYLWNSIANRYMNAYGVDPALGDSIPAQVEWLPIGDIAPHQVSEDLTYITYNDVDMRTVHLDLYFPGRLARELEVIFRSLTVPFSPPPPPPDLSAEAIAALKSFFRGAQLANLESCLLVQIRPADPTVTDRFASDNELCTPLAFELAPLAVPEPVYPPLPKNYGPSIHPLLFSEIYQDRWGGQSFGYGLSFDASSSADFRGLIVEAHGAVPVTVFGSQFQFLQVDSRAQVLPTYLGGPQDEDPGFTLDIRFLQQLIFIVDLSYGTYSDQLSFAKAQQRSRSVLVGPVPITVQGAVTGLIGTDYQIGFGTALNLSATPFASLTASASASAGIPGFGFGIEGGLILLDERFKVSTGASLSVIDDGLNSGSAEILLLPTLQVVNEITGASGTLSLFAEYPVPTITWCGDWIPYPCGLFTINRSHLVLDSYRAFHKVDTLINEQTLITVVNIPGQSPAYYGQ